MSRKVPLKFHPNKGGDEENFKQLQAVLSVLEGYQNNKELDVNSLMATLKRSKNANPETKKLKIFEKILEKYPPGEIPNVGINRIAKAYKKLSEGQPAPKPNPRPEPRPQPKARKTYQPPPSSSSGPRPSSSGATNVPPRATPKQEMDSESDPRVRAEYSAAIRLAEKFNDLYETYRNDAPFQAKSAFNIMKFPNQQGLHKKPPKNNKYAHQLYGDLPNYGQLMGSDLVGMLRDRRIAPGRVTPKSPYVYFDTAYDPASGEYPFRAKVSTMHSNYLLHKKAYNNYIWATGRSYFKGTFMQFPIKHTIKSALIGDDVVKITEDFYEKFKVVVADSIKKDAAVKKRYEKQRNKEREEARKQDEARQSSNREREKAEKEKKDAEDKAKKAEKEKKDAEEKAKKAEKEKKDANDAKKAAEKAAADAAKKAANNSAKEAKKAANNSDKKSKEELLKQLELLMRERLSLQARRDELDRTFRDIAGTLRMTQNEAKSSVERLELQIANLRKEIETFNYNKKADIEKRKQTAMLAAKRLREATESLEKASEMFRTNMKNITEKFAQNDKDIQKVKEKLAKFNKPNSPKPNSPKPTYTKSQGKQKQASSGEGSSGTTNNTPKPQKPQKNINKNKAKANSNAHKGDWVSKYNVEDLKYILKALKLPISGTKPVLQKRIRDGKYTQAYIEQILKPAKK